MSKQTAVRLPEHIYERLRTLSERTGRTATYYIREAIEEHLADIEDVYLAEHALREIRSGKAKPISFDTMSERFGLED